MIGYERSAQNEGYRKPEFLQGSGPSASPLNARMPPKEAKKGFGGTGGKEVEDEGDDDKELDSITASKKLLRVSAFRRTSRFRSSHSREEEEGSAALGSGHTPRTLLLLPSSAFRKTKPESPPSPTTQQETPAREKMRAERKDRDAPRTPRASQLEARRVRLGGAGEGVARAALSGASAGCGDRGAAVRARGARLGGARACDPRGD